MRQVPLPFHSCSTIPHGDKDECTFAPSVSKGPTINTGDCYSQKHCCHRLGQRLNSITISLAGIITTDYFELGEHLQPLLLGRHKRLCVSLCKRVCCVFRLCGVKGGGEGDECYRLSL